MKKFATILTTLLLLSVSTFSKSKDPIVIEVITKFTSIDDALIATKDILLSNKFVATGGIQKTTFTATRTTGSRSDYYVADVTASVVDGKVKITVSFVKFGSGLLKLKKVAGDVKEELEK